MLTNNFKVQPDPNGSAVQRYAAEIAAIDPNADCPHNPRDARAMLDALQRKQRPQRETGNDLRLSQYHVLYNETLPKLAKAKRLGIRPRDAKVPQIPEAGIVTPDHLQVLTGYAQQIDIDIEEFEAQTPEQRRIAKLEAALPKIVAAYNALVSECNDHKARIAKLEAIIEGRAAA